VSLFAHNPHDIEVFQGEAEYVGVYESFDEMDVEILFLLVDGRDIKKVVEYVVFAPGYEDGVWPIEIILAIVCVRRVVR
jgi:hypothetical protein